MNRRMLNAGLWSPDEQLRFENNVREFRTWTYEELCELYRRLKEDPLRFQELRPMYNALKWTIIWRCYRFEAEPVG